MAWASPPPGVESNQWRKSDKREESGGSWIFNSQPYLPFDFFYFFYVVRDLSGRRACYEALISTFLVCAAWIVLGTRRVPSDAIARFVWFLRISTKDSHYAIDERTREL